MKQRYESFGSPGKSHINIGKYQIPEFKHDKHAHIDKRCRPDAQTLSADILRLCRFLIHIKLSGLDSFHLILKLKLRFFYQDT